MCLFETMYDIVHLRHIINYWYAYGVGYSCETNNVEGRNILNILALREKWGE